MEYIVRYPDGQSVFDTQEQALQTVNNLLDHGGVSISDITVWQAQRFEINVSLKLESNT